MKAFANIQVSLSFNEPTKWSKINLPLAFSNLIFQAGVERHQISAERTSAIQKSGYSSDDEKDDGQSDEEEKALESKVSAEEQAYQQARFCIVLAVVQSSCAAQLLSTSVYFLLPCNLVVWDREGGSFASLKPDRYLSSSF